MDLAIVGDDLATEEGLRTAMLLSIFTDRRAEDDDDLPAGDGDRRGWWADQFSIVPGDRLGSRLWLLDRGKQHAELAKDAETYAREALAWLIEDAVLERIDIEVEVRPDMLALQVTPYRPGENTATQFRFQHVWDAEAER
jgi:phage gp46-like protein